MPDRATVSLANDACACLSFGGNMVGISMVVLLWVLPHRTAKSELLF